MEEGWNLGPILIPLLALLAGWAIGFFDSNMRTDKKIKQAEASAQAAIKNAEDKITEAQARIAAIPETVTADDPGVMRIKNENGVLTLDLDGGRVNTSAMTADQRKRLIEMLNTIRPWLEGKPAPAPTKPPPSRPAPVPAPMPPPPPQPVIQAQTPAPKATAPAKKNEEPVAPPTSIVGQINLILQERIANSPLSAKGVSLMESSTGGVNVYVGINRYEAIDDVPDEDAKSAIRAAIAEWEKKYTPGL